MNETDNRPDTVAPATEAAADTTDQPGAEAATAAASDDYETASFGELSAEARAPAGDPAENLDVILDVPVTLSLEVGRTHMSVGELLQISQGSVVELDRLAGEPLDVLVNGTLVAHGEIVVVNDKFGIRLTDVVSPAERVRKLGR